MLPKTPIFLQQNGPTMPNKIDSIVFRHEVVFGSFAVAMLTSVVKQDPGGVASSRLQKSSTRTGSTMMGCVGIAPVSCAQEKGGTARVHLRRVSSCGMSGIINY